MPNATEKYNKIKTENRPLVWQNRNILSKSYFGRKVKQKPNWRIGVDQRENDR